MRVLKEEWLGRFIMDNDLREFNRNFRQLKRDRAIHVMGKIFKGFAKALPRGVDNPDNHIQRPELYGIGKKRRLL